MNYRINVNVILPTEAKLFSLMQSHLKKLIVSIFFPLNTLRMCVPDLVGRILHQLPSMTFLYRLLISQWVTCVHWRCIFLSLNRSIPAWGTHPREGSLNADCLLLPAGLP